MMAVYYVLDPIRVTFDGFGSKAKGKACAKEFARANPGTWVVIQQRSPDAPDLRVRWVDGKAEWQ